MNRTQRRALQDAQLDALYAQIPRVACKGYCHTTCGPIDMSNRERERIAEAGVDIPEVPEGTRLRDLPFTDCPALTADKRCGVYEVRPFVCRVWGSSELLTCIYGCEIDGEPLEAVEELVIGAQVNNVGGWSHDPPPPENATPEAIRRRAAEQPEKMMMMRAEQAHGRRHDRRRAIADGQGHLLAREDGDL